MNDTAYFAQPVYWSKVTSVHAEILEIEDNSHGMGYPFLVINDTLYIGDSEGFHFTLMSAIMEQGEEVANSGDYQFKGRVSTDGYANFYYLGDKVVTELLETFSMLIPDMPTSGTSYYQDDTANFIMFEWKEVTEMGEETFMKEGGTDSNITQVETSDSHGGGLPFFYDTKNDHLYIGSGEGFHHEIYTQVDLDLEDSDYLYADGGDAGLEKGFYSGRAEPDYGIWFHENPDDDVHNRAVELINQTNRFKTASSEWTVEEVVTGGQEFDNRRSWVAKDGMIYIGTGGYHHADLFYKLPHLLEETNFTGIGCAVNGVVYPWQDHSANSEISDTLANHLGFSVDLGYVRSDYGHSSKVAAGYKMEVVPIGDDEHGLGLPFLVFRDTIYLGDNQAYHYSLLYAIEESGVRVYDQDPAFKGRVDSDGEVLFYYLQEPDVEYAEQITHVLGVIMPSMGETESCHVDPYEGNFTMMTWSKVAGRWDNYYRWLILPDGKPVVWHVNEPPFSHYGMADDLGFTKEYLNDQVIGGVLDTGTGELETWYGDTELTFEQAEHLKTLAEEFGIKTALKQAPEGTPEIKVVNTRKNPAHGAGYPWLWDEDRNIIFIGSSEDYHSEVYGGAMEQYGADIENASEGRWPLYGNLVDAKALKLLDEFIRNNEDLFYSGASPEMKFMPDRVGSTAFEVIDVPTESDNHGAGNAFIVFEDGIYLSTTSTGHSELFEKLIDDNWLDGEWRNKGEGRFDPSKDKVFWWDCFLSNEDRQAVEQTLLATMTEPYDIEDDMFDNHVSRSAAAPLTKAFAVDTEGTPPHPDWDNNDLPPGVKQKYLTSLPYIVANGDIYVATTSTYHHDLIERILRQYPNANYDGLYHGRYGEDGYRPIVEEEYDLIKKVMGPPPKTASQMELFDAAPDNESTISGPFIIEAAGMPAEYRDNKRDALARGAMLAKVYKCKVTVSVKQGAYSEVLKVFAAPAANPYQVMLIPCNDDHQGGRPFIIQKNTIYLGEQEGFHWDLAGSIPDDPGSLDYYDDGSGRATSTQIIFYADVPRREDQVVDALVSVMKTLPPTTDINDSEVGQQIEDDNSYGGFFTIHRYAADLPQPLFYETEEIELPMTNEYGDVPFMFSKDGVTAFVGIPSGYHYDLAMAVYPDSTEVYDLTAGEYMETTKTIEFRTKNPPSDQMIKWAADYFPEARRWDNYGGKSGLMRKVEPAPEFTNLSKFAAKPWDDETVEEYRQRQRDRVDRWERQRQDEFTHPSLVAPPVEQQGETEEEYRERLEEMHERWKNKIMLFEEPAMERRWLYHPSVGLKVWDSLAGRQAYYHSMMAQDLKLTVDRDQQKPGDPPPVFFDTDASSGYVIGPDKANYYPDLAWFKHKDATIQALAQYLGTVPTMTSLATDWDTSHPNPGTKPGMVYGRVEKQAIPVNPIYPEKPEEGFGGYEVSSDGRWRWLYSDQWGLHVWPMREAMHSEMVMQLMEPPEGVKPAVGEFNEDWDMPMAAGYIRPDYYGEWEAEIAGISSQDRDMARKARPLIKEWISERNPDNRPISFSRFPPEEHISAALDFNVTEPGWTYEHMYEADGYTCPNPDQAIYLKFIELPERALVRWWFATGYTGYPWHTNMMSQTIEDFDDEWDAENRWPSGYFAGDSGSFGEWTFYEYGAPSPHFSKDEAAVIFAKPLSQISQNVNQGVEPEYEEEEEQEQCERCGDTGQLYEDDDGSMYCNDCFLEVENERHHHGKVSKKIVVHAVPNYSWDGKMGVPLKAMTPVLYYPESGLLFIAPNAGYAMHYSIYEYIEEKNIDLEGKENHGYYFPFLGVQGDMDFKGNCDNPGRGSQYYWYDNFTTPSPDKLTERQVTSAIEGIFPLKDGPLELEAIQPLFAPMPPIGEQTKLFSNWQDGELEDDHDFFCFVYVGGNINKLFIDGHSFHYDLFMNNDQLQEYYDLEIPMLAGQLSVDALEEDENGNPIFTADINIHSDYVGQLDEEETYTYDEEGEEVERERGDYTGVDASLITKATPMIQAWFDEQATPSRVIVSNQYGADYEGEEEQPEEVRWLVFKSGIGGECIIDYAWSHMDLAMDKMNMSPDDFNEAEDNASLLTGGFLDAADTILMYRSFGGYYDEQRVAEIVYEAALKAGFTPTGKASLSEGGGKYKDFQVGTVTSASGGWTVQSLDNSQEDGRGDNPWENGRYPWIAYDDIKTIYVGQSGTHHYPLTLAVDKLGIESFDTSPRCGFIVAKDYKDGVLIHDRKGIFAFNFSYEGPIDPAIGEALEEKYASMNIPDYTMRNYSDPEQWTDLDERVAGAWTEIDEQWRWLWYEPQRWLWVTDANAMRYSHPDMIPQLCTALGDEEGLDWSSYAVPDGTYLGYANADCSEIVGMSADYGDFDLPESCIDALRAHVGEYQTGGSLRTIQAAIKAPEEGEEFLNWQGRKFRFDPTFEGVNREGWNAYDEDELVGSITWSDEGDSIYLRSAFVDPAYRQEGFFQMLFQKMTDDNPGKYVMSDAPKGTLVDSVADDYNYRLGSSGEEAWPFLYNQELDEMLFGDYGDFHYTINNGAWDEEDEGIWAGRLYSNGRVEVYDGGNNPFTLSLKQMALDELPSLLRQITAVVYDDTQFRDIKFVSTPAKLLVGENTYHQYLLQEEYGVDTFPTDTLAIGRAFVKNDEVNTYSFDWVRDPAGKATALTQLAAYCDQMGYLFNAEETWNKMIQLESSQTIRYVMTTDGSVITDELNPQGTHFGLLMAYEVDPDDVIDAGTIKVDPETGEQELDSIWNTRFEDGTAGEWYRKNWKLPYNNPQPSQTLESVV